MQALAFNGLDIASDMLVVHLQKPAPDDLAWVEGSPMAFFSDDRRGEQTAGQLIEVSGNHVYIARDRSRLSQPAEEFEFPTTGSIGVSVREHLATLRRQKDATRRMRSGEVANPRLQDVLSDIRKAEFDQYPPDIEFFQPDLDFDKREAVAHALSTHDVFVIQGPPARQDDCDYRNLASDHP